MVLLASMALQGAPSVDPSWDCTLPAQMTCSAGGCTESEGTLRVRVERDIDQYWRCLDPEGRRCTRHRAVATERPDGLLIQVAGLPMFLMIDESSSAVESASRGTEVFLSRGTCRAMAPRIRITPPTGEE